MRRLALVVGILALLIVVASGISPLHISYVTSDSMEPTLSQGDVYLLLETDDIERDDIITFDAPTREGYVTHRVVGVTDSGYLTKGDANPTTDQRAGAPVIAHEDVVGEAVTVGGHLVVIPKIGVLFGVVQTHPLASAIVFGLLLGLMAIQRFDPVTRSIPDRQVWTAGDVLFPALVGLTLVSFIALSLGVTTHHVVFLVTETGDGEARIPVEEPAERTIDLSISKPPGTTTIIEGEDLTVKSRERQGSTLQVVGQLPPVEETGRYEVSIHVHTYPAIFPRDTLRALHAVHPLVAKFVVVSAMFAPIWLFYYLVIDSRAPLRFRDIRPLRRGGE